MSTANSARPTLSRQTPPVYAYVMMSSAHFLRHFAVLSRPNVHHTPWIRPLNGPVQGLAHKHQTPRFTECGPYIQTEKADFSVTHAGSHLFLPPRGDNTPDSEGLVGGIPLGEAHPRFHSLMTLDGIKFPSWKTHRHKWQHGSLG